MEGAILIFFIGAALLSLCFYFLPVIIAFLRSHPSAMAIAVINFFFGWTIVGWIICLAWSFGGVREIENINNNTVVVNEEKRRTRSGG